ncbi:adenylosuccinate synthetase [Sorangium sp. So ce590]|uniref:adenylosuccinate synthetase n=1 Tax=Sorangium sp. So ce590 TaxID=3133317 RepID=UPI003F5FCCC8
MRSSPSVTCPSTENLTNRLCAGVAGGELGTVTGRPRRTGWLDLPVCRCSLCRWGRGGTRQSCFGTRSAERQAERLFMSITKR